MLPRFGRLLENRLLFPEDRTIVHKAVLNHIALRVLSLQLFLRIEMLILVECSEGIWLLPLSNFILVVVIDSPMISDICTVEFVLF